MVFFTWFLQAVVNTPNQTKQSGQKGGDCMVKFLKVSASNMAANALTALYINNLPAMTIRAL
ncbi:hypothetical protein ALQ35_04980 [Pseudomonas fluorescens]|nr:hypothetical protein ALQ35_04980 [Pseudomonas fluorescens]